MHLSHLSLINFRNYARLEIDLPPAPIVLVGANAQGKTNFLEAIYYLATSRSPYTTTDRQLVNWQAEDDIAPYARLVGEVAGEGGRTTRLEITLRSEPSAGGERLRKYIRVDGVDKRGMDLLGRLNVVFFVPQDLELVEGSPSARRRYLNVTLCQTDSLYCRALSDYDKLITQRNALLRRIRDGFAAPDELSYWDERAAMRGATLIAGRRRLLGALEDEAQRIHHELTGGAEFLRLHYQPSFAPDEEDPDRIAPAFRAALDENRRRAIDRGMTLIGPHRDELRFEVNGHDLGHYGSRGQARTAIMALKLAELAWMRRAVGEWPVLLLDEVVAELDADRRAYLLEAVSDVQQAILATTEAELFTSDFLAHAQQWRIQAGRIASL